MAKKKSRPKIKKLYRSREDKAVAGVCGGIAEYFEVDPVWIRLVAVLLVFAQGVGIILYIMVWILIPKNPLQKATPETRAEKIVHRINHKIKNTHECSALPYSNNRGRFGSFWGLIFIIIGVVLLLKSFGVIRFSLWTAFVTLWPVALIIIGVSLFFRRRGLALMLTLLTIVIAVLLFVNILGIANQRSIVQEVEKKRGIDNADLDINYGMGRLNIAEGEGDFLLRNDIRTSDRKDPYAKGEFKGDKADISLERLGSFVFLNKEENWDIKLSSDAEYRIDLDYGMADIKIDLSDLEVNSLAIDTGMSKTEIIFTDYPTAADLSVGFGSVLLKIPEDMGVIIDSDVGLSSTNLPGFEKVDGKYVRNYDEDDDNIMIEIDAGFSSFDVELY